MILLIDNYDSFTYNLYQYLREMTDEPVTVVRNDAITVEEIAGMKPDRIVISPGPGRPETAGISVEAVRRFAASTPILGICLGCQIIAAAFGARIVGARQIVHGKVDDITLDGKGLFRTLGSPARFTRYHSLAVERASLPDDLEVSATAADGEIMGVRHRHLIVEGVQFHPESIASREGKRLLSNFLHWRRQPFPIAQHLRQIIAGREMSRAESSAFMDELTNGNLTPAQIGGFLIGLNARGITAEELAGCAEVLIAKRRPVKSSKPTLDTCGTGGDGLGTFNISSMAAIVAAACGATVAKHGNRAISSQSGSADFYHALGLPIDLSPDRSERLLEEAGFTFLFAPIYHGAMRHAAAARRELGVKTIMNMLGPLVNPAGARWQLIGVFAPALCATMARAAVMLNIERVMVVYGEDGSDEISLTGPTRVAYAGEGGTIDETTIRPQDFGIEPYAPEELTGGSAERNAVLASELLAGVGTPALRDAVCLNAGAALALCGLANDIDDGLHQAREALQSGTARSKWEEIIRVGTRLRG